MLGYSKDEGGLWYGLCFTDYIDKIKPEITKIKKQRIFGRKVESTFEEKGFYIGQDIEFVNDSCLKSNKRKITKIGSVNLDTKKIKFASQGATGDYKEIINSFKYGLEKRILPPDDYKEHYKLNTFRPDEYFKLTDLIIDKE